MLRPRSSSPRSATSTGASPSSRARPASSNKGQSNLFVMLLSADGLARDHRIVEHKIQGPDPARAFEELGIPSVGRKVRDADIGIGVLVCPRPTGIIES